MSLPQPSSEPATFAAPPCVTPAADPVQWFKQEVHPHDGQLKSWLRGTYPGARSDVEDIVQESYLRIWKAKARHPITSAKAFLFSIARHLTLNHLRRARISPLVSDGDSAGLSVLDNGPGVAEILTEQEKVDLLGDALVALPVKTREILILNKFQGHTQADIARRLGVTEKSVEHQVARGIRLCAEFLRARGL